MSKEQPKVYKELTDEQLELLGETVRAAASAFTKAVAAFIETFKEVWSCLGDQLTRFGAALAPILRACAEERRILETCPNRRVVHLAKHAKKKRTRKKNLHRAAKMLEREASR